MQGVNPTVVYISMVLLAILVVVGEYVHVLPMGTAAVFIGGLLGHGVSIVSGTTTPQKGTDSAK